MRMKTVKAVRAAAHWIQRILEVQLPMGASNGLRTRGTGNGRDANQERREKQ
jgi:hypothetical protein